MAFSRHLAVLGLKRCTSARAKVLLEMATNDPRPKVAALARDALVEMGKAPPSDGSMIFTTNKLPKAWGRVLHDKALAHAIVDRVLELGRLFKLDGPSIRIRHLQLDEAINAGSDQADEVAGVSGTHTARGLLCGTCRLAAPLLVRAGTPLATCRITRPAWPDAPGDGEGAAARGAAA